MSEPSTRLVNGNVTVVDAAILGDMHGFFGYPITPSSAILEQCAVRFPTLEKGAFVQCEDEIAAITACIGSSWTGLKTFTATSGPGFSLMQEGIGLAAITETPIVLINVQRAGPSTGLPTLAGQGETMQSKFGSHGDYSPLVLVPNSVQETFDLTIEAINLSEFLRVPVIVMTDQVISACLEKMVIPAKEKVELVTRPTPDNPNPVYKGVKLDSEIVPPMAIFGHGHKGFGTGLSHGISGTPDLTAETFELLIKRLKKKMKHYMHLFPKAEEYMMDDAEIVVVAYGSTARAAKRAVIRAREEGIKAGMYRIKTLWPFPEKDMEKIAEKAKKIIVPEMSLGQLIWPVERYGRKKAVGITSLRGRPVTPGEIIEEMKK
ncbi:MAG: 2-oxoacid:acceptor oxidoreductase subunit alpha [Candidatus Kariarchaeaceae archaeon]